MPTLKSGDRCADCKHVKIWTTDHHKATCTIFKEQGFHPDSPAPTKCVNKVTRKY